MPQAVRTQCGKKRYLVQIDKTPANYIVYINEVYRCIPPPRHKMAKKKMVKRRVPSKSNPDTKNVERLETGSHTTNGSQYPEHWLSAFSFPLIKVNDLPFFTLPNRCFALSLLLCRSFLTAPGLFYCYRSSPPRCHLSFSHISLNLHVVSFACTHQLHTLSLSSTPSSAYRK